jgi:hypothetical protein
MAHQQVIAYGYFLDTPNNVGVNLTTSETYQDMSCQIRKNLGIGCPILDNQNIINANKNYRIIGKLPTKILDQNSKIQYWATKPGTFFSSIEDAFIDTPNKGIVYAKDGKFVIDLAYPASYQRLTGDGYYQYNTPRLNILIGDDPHSTIYRIELSPRVEYFGSQIINNRQKLIIPLMILIIGVCLVIGLFE